MTIHAIRCHCDTNTHELFWCNAMMLGRRRRCQHNRNKNRSQMPWTLIISLSVLVFALARFFSFCVSACTPTPMFATNRRTGKNRCRDYKRNTRAILLVCCIKFTAIDSYHRERHQLYACKTSCEALFSFLTIKIASAATEFKSDKNRRWKKFETKICWRRRSPHDDK